jgi:hypothetical protein
VALTQADVAVAGQNDVVQNVDVEERAGLPDLARDRYVVCAGRRIARGVETAMLALAMLIDGANIATFQP